MSLFLKMTISLSILLLAHHVARKHPSLGGWVTAFPFVTMLTLAWMAGDRRPTGEIAGYLRGVTLGLLPTLALLSLGTVALQRGFSLSVSLGLAFALWLSVTLTARQLGLI